MPGGGEGMEAITHQKDSEGFSVEGQYLLDFKYFQPGRFPAPHQPRGREGRSGVPSSRPGGEAVLQTQVERVGRGAELPPTPLRPRRAPGDMSGVYLRPAAVCGSSWFPETAGKIFLAPHALPSPARGPGLDCACDRGDAP